MQADFIACIYNDHVSDPKFKDTWSIFLSRERVIGCLLYNQGQLYEWRLKVIINIYGQDSIVFEKVRDDSWVRLKVKMEKEREISFMDLIHPIGVDSSVTKAKVNCLRDWFNHIGFYHMVPEEQFIGTDDVTDHEAIRSFFCWFLSSL